MKKFLTVLLALSVVFTYTVGTAFAADEVPGTSTTYQQKLDTAAEEIAKDLAATKSATVAGLAAKYTETATDSAGNNVTITIAKAVYESVAGDVHTDYAKVLTIAKTQLEKAYAAAIDKTVLDAKTVAEVKADLIAEEVAASVTDYAGMKIADVDAVADYKALVLSTGGKDAYKQNAFSYAFQAEKDRVIAELNKIDLSLYSDDVMDPVNDAYKTTYAQLAATTKEKMIAEAGKIAIESDFTVAKIAGEVYNLQQMIDVPSKLKIEDSYKGLDNVVTVTSYSLVGVNLVANGVSTLLQTKEDLKNNGASLESKKLAAKADAQAKAAEFYKNALTAYNASDKGTVAKNTFDAAVKEKDAYLEVELYRIDQLTADPIAATALTVGVVNTNLVKEYQDLVDYANICKKMVEKDGSLKYDAAKIDKNLADAKTKVYDRDSGTVATIADITAGAENKIEDVDFEKAVAVAQLEAARDKALYAKDGSDKYYDIEKAKITERYAEVIAKVNAATTVDQVNQINKVVNIAAIHDKAGIIADIKGRSKFNAELNKVNAYVGYLNTGLNEWDDAYRAPVTSTDLATFYAEKGARTNDEIQSLLAEAKAMADKIPTKKEAAEAKKAVEELVKALPNNITLADKEAVKAAYDAAEKLGVTLENQARLDAAIIAVQNAEKKSIDKLVDALPALNKITITDKEAVQAVADAIKAYDSTMMYTSVYDSNNPTTLSKYQVAVRNAAQAEVVAAIAAITEGNPTKSEVKAARDLYDAFVKEYTDYEADYDARDVINVDKLLFAEATLAAQAIADVEGLKITASSKAGKGYIQIKWTVKGDAEAADGYQVYRSVKRNSGFGTKPYFTTKNKTYKNTKSLKKGKRYYYKVRAYKVVDGKKIYSDWSNKAYRIAK